MLIRQSLKWLVTDLFPTFAAVGRIAFVLDTAKDAVFLVSAISQSGIRLRDRCRVWQRLVDVGAPNRPNRQRKRSCNGKDNQD